MQVILEIAFRILNRPVHPIFKTRSELANAYIMVDIPTCLLMLVGCIRKFLPMDILEVLVEGVGSGFADRLMAIWMTMQEERAQGSAYEPYDDFALSMWTSVVREFTTWLEKDARTTYEVLRRCTAMAGQAEANRLAASRPISANRRVYTVSDPATGQVAADPHPTIPDPATDHSRPTQRAAANPPPSAPQSTANSRLASQQVAGNLPPATQRAPTNPAPTIEPVTAGPNPADQQVATCSSPMTELDHEEVYAEPISFDGVYESLNRHITVTYQNLSNSQKSKLALKVARACDSAIKVIMTGCGCIKYNKKQVVTTVFNIKPVPPKTTVNGIDTLAKIGQSIRLLEGGLIYDKLIDHGCVDHLAGSLLALSRGLKRYAPIDVECLVKNQKDGGLVVRLEQLKGWMRCTTEVDCDVAVAGVLQYA